MARSLTMFFLRKRTERELRKLREKSKKNPDKLLLRLRLGDLQSKMGMKEEALRTYHLLAREYARKGMLRQAMAVNKVILRLDSTQTRLYDELREIQFQRNLYLHTLSWKTS